MLVFLLLCRIPDLYSMRHFHPRIIARFQKQALYTMKFLKFKKVAILHAMTRWNRDFLPRDMHIPIFQPTISFSYFSLSVVSISLPHHKTSTRPERCSSSFSREIWTSFQFFILSIFWFIEKLLCSDSVKLKPDHLKLRSGSLPANLFMSQMPDTSFSLASAFSLKDAWLQ